MWWFKRRKWNRGSSDCSSCKVTEVDDMSTGFLDKTQHRSSSIASLLSIEQSLVTHDDQNRMMLVPLLCLQGNIPAEVNFSSNTIRQDENLNVQSVDDNCVHVQTTIDNHINANATFDELENTSLSDSINDDIETYDADVENPMPLGITTKSLEVKRSPQRVSKKVAIQFGSVEVHEHELTLCRSSVPMRGPPLGLGQSRVCYRKFESVDEHLYETYLGGGPRPLNQLHQPSEQRVDILLDLGYSMREIRSSTREAGIVRTKRLQSARFSSRTKSFVVVRKVVRGLSHRSSNKSNAKDWQCRAILASKVAIKTTA